MRKRRYFYLDLPPFETVAMCRRCFQDITLAAKNEEDAIKELSSIGWGIIGVSVFCPECLKTLKGE